MQLVNLKNNFHLKFIYSFTRKLVKVNLLFGHTLVHEQYQIKSNQIKLNATIDKTTTNHEIHMSIFSQIKIFAISATYLYQSSLYCIIRTHNSLKKCEYLIV